MPMLQVVEQKQELDKPDLHQLEQSLVYLELHRLQLAPKQLVEVVHHLALDPLTC